MISTTCSHALLIVIGIFQGEAAILESYESQWDNLPEGVASIWEYVFKKEGHHSALTELFPNFLPNPGFWVWEGTLCIELEGPTLIGKWRRAQRDEVSSWYDITMLVHDRPTEPNPV